MLDASALARYRAEGFLVFPGAIPRADCDALCADLSTRIAAISAEYAAGTRAQVGFWDLMRRSRDRVEVFWDPSHENPGEGLEGATMRVGHALHTADAAFAAFCGREEIRVPLRRLVGGEGHVCTSAVIYKQPRSEIVQFGMHQDASYLTTQPESLALAFVALDDMDRENGCLEVIPGSHAAPLTMALRMGPDGYVPAMGRMPRSPPRDRGVALTVEKGSVILVHGRTYHASEPNRSDRPRRALIVHAMSARSRFAPTTWLLDERGQPPPLVPV